MLELTSLRVSGIEPILTNVASVSADSKDSILVIEAVPPEIVV